MMYETIKKNKRTYAVALIAITLIAAGVVVSNWFSVIAFILVLMFALLMPTGETYCLLFGLLPYANVFKLDPDTTSFFTILGLAVTLVGVIKIKRINTPFLISLCSLFVYLSIFSLENFEILTIVKVIDGFLLVYLGQFISKRKI